MNIFYFFKELDTPMYQWQRTNLIDELIRNGHKVKTFNPLDYQSIEEANAITVPSIKKWGKCDLFLTCDDQDTIFKETVEEINKMGIPTCLICWDNLELPFKQKKRSLLHSTLYGLLLLKHNICLNSGDAKTSYSKLMQPTHILIQPKI